MQVIFNKYFKYYFIYCIIFIGIIRSFKSKYRTKIVKYILKVYEEKKRVEEIDVKQAIYFIREAWREVSKETIQNCWRKTEITKNEEDISQVIAAIIEEEKKVEEELAVDFSKLTKGEISQWFQQFKYTPKEYIDVDADVENSDKLSEREIFEMVTDKEKKDNEEEELHDDSEPPKVISSKEANECYEKLLEYFSTQSAESESFETDLDRMTEIGRRLEEIKEERKSQAKLTVMFDFQKI